MPTPGDAVRVATLWQLSWGDNRLSCVIDRTDDGLRLSLESSTATVLSQHFDLQPRAMARAQALRDALKRRGWKDVA